MSVYICVYMYMSVYICVYMYLSIDMSYIYHIYCDIVWRFSKHSTKGTEHLLALLLPLYIWHVWCKESKHPLPLEMHCLGVLFTCSIHTWNASHSPCSLFLALLHFAPRIFFNSLGMATTLAMEKWYRMRQK